VIGASIFVEDQIDLVDGVVVRSVWHLLEPALWHLVVGFVGDSPFGIRMQACGGWVPRRCISLGGNEASLALGLRSGVVRFAAKRLINDQYGVLTFPFA
jgi:hypothetical protein